MRRNKVEKQNLPKMTCAFIIRLHYEDTDPRFAWRLKHFTEEVLPRIWAQTDKDFDVCVRCNPKHYDIFKSLGCQPFHVKNEYAEYVLARNQKAKYFYDFIKWEDCLDLKQYDIQIGLDSDDFIAPNYVQRIKQECAKSKTSLHIYFQPEEFVLKTKEIKNHNERYKIDLKNGSMFLALYYPEKSIYHHCYETSHRLLYKLAERSVLISSGYCWLVIHDQNESSGRKFTDEELVGVKQWNKRPWSDQMNGEEYVSSVSNKRKIIMGIKNPILGYQYGTNFLRARSNQLTHYLNTIIDPDRYSLIYILCKVPVVKVLFKKIFSHRLLISSWREERKLVNFGDYITEILLNKFGYKTVNYCHVKSLGTLVKYDFCFLVIGSLLNKQKLDELNVRQVFVWGQGKGTGDFFDINKEPYLSKVHISAVRGPHTIRQLNLSENTPVGDPALLLPLFFKVDRDHSQYKITYVPHHSNRNGWARKINTIGAERYIDIMCTRSEFWSRLRQIVSSKFVLTNTLHTAIVCQAYKVPWALCLAEDDELNFPDKWRDFFEYLGVDKQENLVNNYVDGLKWWQDIGSNIKVRSLLPLLDSFPLPIRDKNVMHLINEINSGN